jgi:hypothetical protein
MYVIRDIFRSTGIALEFRRGGGPKEWFYQAEGVVAGHRVEIYVYEDEAQFSVDDHDIDCRLEKWDYRSQDALIADLAKRLRNVLATLIAPA